jgi:hypothetical protein
MLAELWWGVLLKGCFGIKSGGTLDYSSRLNYVVSSCTVKLLAIISEGKTGKK